MRRIYTVQEHLLEPRESDLPHFATAMISSGARLLVRRHYDSSCVSLPCYIRCVPRDGVFAGVIQQCAEESTDLDPMLIVFAKYVVVQLSGDFSCLCYEVWRGDVERQSLRNLFMGE